MAKSDWDVEYPYPSNGSAQRREMVWLDKSVFPVIRRYRVPRSWAGRNSHIRKMLSHRSIWGFYRPEPTPPDWWERLLGMVVKLRMCDQWNHPTNRVDGIDALKYWLEIYERTKTQAPVETGKRAGKTKRRARQDSRAVPSP